MILQFLTTNAALVKFEFPRTPARSCHESHVLRLNHPLSPMARLASPLRTNFLLVRHQYEAIAEALHRSIFPLVQTYVARYLHRQAHVLLQLFLAFALNRRKRAVQDMHVYRLRLKMRPRHFFLEARRESGRVMHHIAVVADVRQPTATGLSDGWHVERCELIARAVQCRVEGIGKMLRSVCRDARVIRFCERRHCEQK